MYKCTWTNLSTEKSYCVPVVQEHVQVLTVHEKSYRVPVVQEHVQVLTVHMLCSRFLLEMKGFQMSYFNSLGLMGDVSVVVSP